MIFWTWLSDFIISRHNCLIQQTLQYAISYMLKYNDHPQWSYFVKSIWFRMRITMLASGRRRRPSRVKDRAWYHSNRLEKLIRLHPFDCLFMDVRWENNWVKVENSRKKHFWSSKNRKPELLLDQSYSFFPLLSTRVPRFGLSWKNYIENRENKSACQAGSNDIMPDP